MYLYNNFRTAKPLPTANTDKSLSSESNPSLIPTPDTSKLIESVSQRSTSTSTVLDSAPSPILDRSKLEEYKGGSPIENLGFRIDTPSGWKINLMKEKSMISNNTRLNTLYFDIAPSEWQTPKNVSGWMGFATIRIDVLPAKSTLDLWLSDFLSNYEKGLLKINQASVGNKSGYFIIPPSAPITPSTASSGQTGLEPFYVILGKEHSYRLGFGNEMNQEIYERLKKRSSPAILF